VLSVAVSPDSLLVLSGSKDHTLHLWSMETGKERVLSSCCGFSVTFSPDGKVALTGSCQAWAQGYNVASGKAQGALVGTGQPVEAVAVSPDFRWVVTGTGRGTLQLWDPKITKSKPVSTFKASGHAGPVKSVAFSPDSRWILSGGADRRLRLWDVEIGALVHDFGVHGGAVNSVAFSADGR